MDDIAIIENKIYEIRGQKVMLDFDLAEMYGVETKRLKEQVRRNIERFPAEFMFELTKEEVAISRSQIATLKTGQGYNIKYLPFAFTEYGTLKSGTRYDVVPPRTFPDKLYRHQKKRATPSERRCKPLPPLLPYGSDAFPFHRLPSRLSA